MSPRLLSVGNAVIDLLVTVPRLPGSGDDVTATDSVTTVGGGGANALVAARRQGLACLYAGAHGTGPFGDLVRAAFAAEGIDLAHPPVATSDTGWDLAITEPGGERTFVTSVGSEAELDRRALDGLHPNVGDFVHVSGYGLARVPNGSAIAAWVAALPSGITVVYDPGPLGASLAPGVRDLVQGRVDWWSGNEREALAVTGVGDPLAAVETLAGEGVGVVMRRGADGCLLRQPARETVAVPGFAVEPIDSNGAGDAHVGVFIAGLAAGIPPVDAARRANAAAAIVVTRRGPATAPSGAELDTFLARMIES